MIHSLRDIYSDRLYSISPPGAAKAPAHIHRGPGRLDRSGPVVPVRSGAKKEQRPAVP